MRVMPFLRREVIEPLLSARNRSPFLKYWKALEETQYYPEETLRDFQWNKFKKILEYGYNNNNYYKNKFKEIDLHPQDIRSIADVKNIPILTKKDVRLAGDQIISNGFAQKDLIEAKTGGSTGKPIILYFNEDCSERRNACTRRHDRWSGWKVGEPKGYVWGNPQLPKTLKEKLKWTFVAPIIFLDTMAVTKETVIEFSCKWKRCKPTLLFGHAHSLYLLADLVKKYQIEDLMPKAIISSSMMLLQHERKHIEDIFGRKVFDRYGCEEVGLIASECEKHEGMHLNIDHLLVEFIREDGSNCEPGELGKILVTDLISETMPLIRYQVEDMGVPSFRKCSCGRGLPLMDEVSGRTADFLVKKDGTKVAGISLIENTLTRIPGIEQMQIIQESLETIRIKLVPGENYLPSNSAVLVGYFKELFLDPELVEIEINETIQPEKSGKYRFSICRIDG